MLPAANTAAGNAVSSTARERLNVRICSMTAEPRPRLLRNEECPHLFGEAVGGFDELAGGAGFEGRVAGVGNQAQVGFGPGFLEIPGAARGADHVEASLHDDGRDVPDLGHV